MNAVPGPADETALELLLSAPDEEVGETLNALGGDVVLLGAGGKIGPSLARMARRGLDRVGSSARVIAVSRFSDAVLVEQLRADGVEVVVADLADPASFNELPDAAGLLYLAAMKFGTAGQEHRTWWSNAAIPTMVTNRYRGVPCMVYSTGNVYPLTPVLRGGCLESDAPSPLGEYAQSCLARERVFAAAAETWGTPTTVFRLNYACELRYGVIADLAVKVASGQPVDVTMPAVNVAWQGDVNRWALRSFELASTPPHVLNATGPETVSVRRLATWLGEDLGTAISFIGVEDEDALLNDAAECHERYGYPTVPLRRLVRWVADWVGGGGRQLGRPTKFSERRGSY